jgi:hypothetical protein
MVSGPEPVVALLIVVIVILALTPAIVTICILIFRRPDHGPSARPKIEPQLRCFPVILAKQTAVESPRENRDDNTFRHES